MKRILTIVFAFAIALGGAAAATAERPAEPGREHGLCTAFFNGQKNGHEKQDEYPGPFQDLVDDAPDGSDEGSEGGSVADLYDWCQQFGIGGNPDHGRFDCGPNEDGQTECSENPAPGNS